MPWKPFIIAIVIIGILAINVYAERRKPLDPVHWVKFQLQDEDPACALKDYGIMFGSLDDTNPYWLTPKFKSDGTRGCDSFLMITQDQNTNSLNISPILLEDGTVSAPSLAFINDEQAGIYRPTTKTVGFAVDGEQKFVVGDSDSYFLTDLAVGKVSADSMFTIKAEDTNIFADFEGGIGDYLAFGYSTHASNAGAYIRCSDNRLRFISTNNLYMTYSEYGTLGLNTLAPGAWLEVISAGGGAPVFSGKAYGPQTVDIMRIYDGADNKLLVMDANGNVGINKASPTRELDVDGNVLISGELLANDYFSGDGSQGLTVSITVKGSDSNDCILTFKDGLLTAETCP